MIKLIYATTNKSKIDIMQKSLEALDIEILSLNDVSTSKLSKIEENGSSPLENARIKALAYYNALGLPLFSCDSGLYIDGLDENRQPGINVRGPCDHMSDEEAITYYSALANEMGGSMVAQYKNAICLILSNEKIYEYMGDDIASEPFIITGKPHKKRNECFPIDSLSVHINSDRYYLDMEDMQYTTAFAAGFKDFFCRTLKPA